jgi:hypothetical protein
MRRLLLCAGGERREGWTHHDGKERPGIDIAGLIPPLPKEITSRKWDIIEWIHGPASVNPWELLLVLEAVRFCLSCDGILAMETPNIDLCMRASKLEWVFGDPGPRENLHMNRWGYTPATLEAVCRKAGFGRFAHLPAEQHLRTRDFRLEAKV